MSLSDCTWSLGGLALSLPGLFLAACCCWCCCFIFVLLLVEAMMMLWPTLCWLLAGTGRSDTLTHSHTVVDTVETLPMEIADSQSRASHTAMEQATKTLLGVGHLAALPQAAAG